MYASPSCWELGRPTGADREPTESFDNRLLWAGGQSFFLSGNRVKSLDELSKRLVNLGAMSQKAGGALRSLRRSPSGADPLGVTDYDEIQALVTTDSSQRTASPVTAHTPH